MNTAHLPVNTVLARSRTLRRQAQPVPLDSAGGRSEGRLGRFPGSCTGRVPPHHTTPQSPGSGVLSQLKLILKILCLPPNPSPKENQMNATMAPTIDSDCAKPGKGDRATVLRGST